MTAKNSEKNEQLRQRNKDAFQKSALHWNNLANERLFEISKQLLGITLIILPLTGSIILANRIITPNEIELFVFGWITLFISIISGFINLWTEAKYFQYLSNDSSLREVIWSDSNRSVKEMDKKTTKLGSTKSISSPVPLIIQIATLFLGVILIMFVIYSLMKTQKIESKQYHLKWNRQQCCFNYRK